MKTKIIALALIFTPLIGHAGQSLSPEGVVALAVVASQKNILDQFVRCCDLISMAEQKRDALVPEKALKVLKAIDLSTSKIVLISLEKSKAIVRIEGPVPMNFELSGSEDFNSSTFYRITAIHPAKSSEQQAASGRTATRSFSKWK